MYANILLLFFSTLGETRTLNPLQATDFKSVMYTIPSLEYHQLLLFFIHYGLKRRIITFSSIV